jgi:hypothetical protein
MADERFISGTRGGTVPGRPNGGEKLHLQLRAEQAECRRLRNLNDGLQKELTELTELFRHIYTQLSGGNLDPHCAKAHPGQLLLSLGWKFTAPDLAEGESAAFDRELTAEEISNLYRMGRLDKDGIYCWEDPEEKPGKRSWHCLTGALNVAFRRFLGWSLEGGPESAPKGVTRYERMLEDDDSEG